MSTVNANIRPGGFTTAQFTANAAVVLLDRQIVYCTDGADKGKYKLGDGVTALSALTFYGGVSSSGLTVGTSAITGGTNTRILYNNNGVLGEYSVTGTGTTAVLSTSPTFTTSIFSPIVYGGAGSGGTIQIDSTSHGTKGTITFGTSSSSNKHLFYCTSNTGSILIAPMSGAGTQAALYMNVLPGSESSTNYVLNYDGNQNFNSQTDGLILKTTGASRLTIQSGNTTSADHFLWNPASRTALTASANVKIFRVATSTQTWATGAVATVYNSWFETQTIAAAGASTFTNVYNLFVEAATAGTNATITNNYALGISGSASVTNGSVIVFPTTIEGVTIKRRSSTANCLTIGADASTRASFDVNNSDYMFNINSVEHFKIRANAIAGLSNSFIFSAPSNTGQGATLEATGYLYNSYSRQWATGDITTQRERWYKTVTYTAVGASVITNAYGAYFEAPTASTNIIITNNYAAGFSGNINIIGTPYVSGVAGVDGSFTTVDGKTVTVTKGIITSIV